MTTPHVIEYEITAGQATAAADAVIDSLRLPPGTLKLRSLLIQAVLYSVFAVASVVIGIRLGQPWWFFIPAVLLFLIVALLIGLTALVSAFGPGGGWHRQRLDSAIRMAFERLESPHIKWTVTEDRLSVQSGGDVREFPWTDVKDIFLTGTFWIMRVQNAPTMLLLADRIPDATARFLLSRARDVGATIRLPSSNRPQSEEDGSPEF